MGRGAVAGLQRVFLRCLIETSGAMLFCSVIIRALQRACLRCLIETHLLPLLSSS